MQTETDQELIDQIRSARWQAFPPHTVVSVLPDTRQAADARKLLLEAGFSDPDMMIAQGDSGAEVLDPSDNQSWTASFARMIQSLGDARIYLEKYAQMVSDGRCFVAVRYETDEQRDDAVTILDNAGAVKLGYTEDATFVPKRD